MEQMQMMSSTISNALVILSFFAGVYKVIRSMEKMKDNFDKRLNEIDEATCKNFLVRFLKDVEQGHKIDEVEEQRAHEVYEHYIKDLHKNSYIHAKWDKLMK